MNGVASGYPVPGAVQHVLTMWVARATDAAPIFLRCTSAYSAAACTENNNNQENGSFHG